MRIVTVRSGTYAGKHNVYDSIDEANANGIADIVDPWYEATVEGSWVHTDDGYVIQLLQIYKMPNKRKRKGHTITYRTCTGTTYIYHRADGSKFIRNMYGGKMQAKKNTMSNRQAILLKRRERELFAKNIANNMSAQDAFKASYGPMYNSTYYIGLLLSDKQVLNSILREMKMGNFLSKVEDNIKKETGLSLHDFMAARVTELLMTPRVNLNNIKLGIELFGEELEIVKPKGGAIDAHYSMVPPDELEQHYTAEENQLNEPRANSRDFFNRELVVEYNTMDFNVYLN